MYNSYFKRILSCLFFVLLLVACLIPNHYPPIPSFYNEFVAFLALLILLLALLGCSLVVDRIVILVMLVLVLIWVQYLFDLYLFESDILFSCIFLAALLFSYQIGRILKYDDQIIEMLFLFFVVAAVVSALIGINQWFGGEHLFLVGVPSYSRAVGNLAQANNYATLLAMSNVPLLYYLLKKRISWPTYLIVMCTIAMGASFSQSRTGFIQWGVVWIGSFSYLVVKRQGWVCLLLLIPMALYFLMSIGVSYLQVAMNYEGSASNHIVNGPFANRLKVWGSMLYGAYEGGGILGFGWGQTVLAQHEGLKYIDGQVNYSEYAHNFFLDIYIWCGPISALAVVVTLFYHGVKVLISKGTLRHGAVLLMLMAFGVHCMTEMPHVYSYFIIPIALMLGYVSRGEKIYFQLSVYVSTMIVAFIFFVGVFLSIFVFKDYRVIEEDHRLMRGENYGLFPRSTQPPISEATLFFELEKEYIRFARTPARKGMLEFELQEVKKMAIRKPLSVVLYRAAVAYSLNDRVDEGKAFLEKIRHFRGEDEFNYYSYFYEESLKEGKEM